MRTNDELCIHKHKVWRGEIQFCLECSEQTDFKDMSLEVKFPNEINE